MTRLGFAMRSTHRRAGVRRLLAALTAAGLLAGLVGWAPAAAADRGRGFGSFLGLQKHVGTAVHTDSLRAVAAAAALAPKPAPAPALNLKDPQVKRSNHATSLAYANAPTVGAPSPKIVLPPDPVASTTWDGLTEAMAGGENPADPWVAANSSFVIQAVNDEFQIRTRTGTALFAVPNEAFFATEPGHFASDPRVIWDPTHNRWVASSVFFTNDLSDDGLSLAVSDGPDPSLGWTIRPIFFGAPGFLPDFPSLASTGDKITIADNVYDHTEAFLAADLNTIRWSEILAGVIPTVHFCDDSTQFVPRAAQALSATNDVHVVMVDIASGDENYVRITGVGECVDILDFTDLSTSIGVPSLATFPVAPPAPRQPGPDTIDNATDGRFTDAVWQNNQLYWVNTDPVTYDAGATWNDQVIVWSVTTQTGSGSPTAFSWEAVRPGDTVDAYLGGIGLTRGGTPVVTWSQSSTTEKIDFFAATITSGGAPGTIGTPVLLDSSEGSISGERWGDYAAVAMDPTGTGSVWVTQMLAANDGSWRTRITRLLLDTTGPSTPGVPSVSPVTGTVLDVLPKFKVSWAAATDAGSGQVAFYILEESIDGGGYVVTGYLTSPSAIRSLSPSHTYQFRVTAVDPVGNPSAVATGPVLHIGIGQSPTSKVGTWHTASGSGYSGGSTWYASTANASATYSTTNVRSLAFVTTRASSRGSFKIYIDGVFKGTFSATASTVVNQWVIYQASWSTPGTHSIKVVVVGTTGHPRVDVDAFIVLK